MSARKSLSLHSAHPPLGGMATRPLLIDLTSCSSPLRRRLPHCCASPRRGALAAPTSWQDEQKVSYCCSVLVDAVPSTSLQAPRAQERTRAVNSAAGLIIVST